MFHHISLLRTVAILLVLFFHFDNQLVSSGYIGVDIFFVISGYLITKITLTRVKDRQTLKDFYHRRIMRIFPALLLVGFIVIFFLSLIEYLELETLQMFRDTLAFTSNIKAEKINLDYFGDNKNNYLLHLWSIAIEIQFYLFFPSLMLSQKIRKYFHFIVFTLLILSLAFLFSEISYYNSFGRIFAFMAGVLTYLLVNKFQPNNYIFLFSIFSLIFIGFLDLNITTYPNHNNIIVALLTAIGLLFGKINENKVLKPLIFIGLISYSLYLWHYPLFLFFHHMNIETSVINTLLLASVLLLLSTGSYFAVEKRFTSKKYGNLTTLLIILPLIFLIFLVHYKRSQTMDIPFVNSFYEKMTLNPLLHYSDLATLEVSRNYPNCLENKGELLTHCSTTKVNDKTKTALVLGNSFVHSGGLIFLDMITAHYNIKSDFYYLFGDKIKTDKLYQTIKTGKYDFLILYYPWWGATKKNLIDEYLELSKYTQIVFVKGTKYNQKIDKKQLFRFNNLFVTDSKQAFKCFTQKPFTTDKDYAVVDSVLEQLNAKSINIHEVQKDNNANYICSHNNIALYLDSSHINNYAGELFAKRFIERDLGRDVFKPKSA
ncbi:MAG: acyltransferase [Campylobacterales bacterium]|nr:acyltransferase [Campylobacterales bacterium]